MLKKAIVFLLCLCMVLAMSACAAGKSNSESSARPENWDTEAEFLKWYNGFYGARTVEDLEPYVLRSSTKLQKEKYIETEKELRAGVVEGFPYAYDYIYDSVELTFLENYKGYDLFWANAKSSAYTKAIEDFYAALEDPNDPTFGRGEIHGYTYIGGNLLVALTIEDGHYVSNLNEAFFREIQRKYTYCTSCGGSGSILEPGEEICPVCNGDAFIEECGSCHASLENTASENETSVGTPSEKGKCPNCGDLNSLSLMRSCSNCFGGREYVDMPCADCEGKGYMKVD